MNSNFIVSLSIKYIEISDFVIFAVRINVSAFFDAFCGERRQASGCVFAPLQRPGPYQVGLVGVFNIFSCINFYF